jgi:glutaredoxin
MHIVVYGIEGCPFCVETQKLLDENNLKYTYYNINTLISEKVISDSNEFRQKLHSRIGDYSFVPLIFVNGNFIGGLRELKRDLSKIKRNLNKKEISHNLPAKRENNRKRSQSPVRRNRTKTTNKNH